MKNDIACNKKDENKIQLENITMYFEYSKNNKKFEECLENILKNQLRGMNVR